jgi:phage replication-related protein YjqB (UPF0714/DUF867 family)
MVLKKKGDLIHLPSLAVKYYHGIVIFYHEIVIALHGLKKKKGDLIHLPSLAVKYYQGIVIFYHEIVIALHGLKKKGRPHPSPLACSKKLHTNLLTTQ